MTGAGDKALLAQVNEALCLAIGVLMRPVGGDGPDWGILDARMACLRAQDAIAKSNRRERVVTGAAELEASND